MRPSARGRGAAAGRRRGAGRGGRARGGAARKTAHAHQNGASRHDARHAHARMSKLCNAVGMPLTTALTSPTPQSYALRAARALLAVRVALNSS
eukprot:scaffold51088_cov60-Phaeocystis_antarctica.AAC.7